MENIVKQEQLYEGKAKKVYATNDPNLVIVDYKDDATAFNGEKKGTISGKGVINNRMTNYMFGLLEKAGVPTHLVKEISDRETIVKKVEIVPLEVIVRNVAAGSFSKRLGVPFGIIDLSLAPTPAVGDSIAEIFNEMGLEHAGAPGTTAALAMLNDNVKKGGIMASSYVGGLSGAFIPVSEDHGMIEAAEIGALTLEKLEAMTCVCSVGLVDAQHHTTR